MTLSRGNMSSVQNRRTQVRRCEDVHDIHRGIDSVRLSRAEDEELAEHLGAKERANSPGLQCNVSVGIDSAESKPYATYANRTEVLVLRGHRHDAIERHLGTYIAGDLALDHLLVLIARGRLAVHLDGDLLRNERIEGVVELLGCLGTIQGVDVLLKPVREVGEDDISGHG